jgi:hypothetical protein
MWLPLLLTVAFVQADSFKCPMTGTSKDCDVLGKIKDATIQTGGGRFANPMLDLKTKTDGEATRVAEIQDDIQTFLDKVKQPAMSRRFRRALLSETVLSAIASEKPVTVPWPAGAADAKVQEVDFSTFQNGFLDKLSEKDSDALDALGTRLQTKDAADPKKMGISKKRIADVAKLVDQAKTSLIGFILKGRSESALNPAELGALKRVRSVQFVGLGHPSFAEDFDCEGKDPDASYDAETHSLTICPETYNYPDANIIQIIGHEIGHSVDPCATQFNLYNVDNKKLAAYIKDTPLADTDSHWALDLLKDKASEGYVSSQFARHLKDAGFLNKLEKAGVLSRQADGTPDKDYFLGPMVACLTGEAGIHGDSEDTAQTAKDEQAFLHDNNVDSAPLSAKFPTRNPHCNDIDAAHPSQVCEAVADSFGANALADYLKTHPPKAVLDCIAPFADFYQELCRTPAKRESDTIKDLTEEDPDDFQPDSFDDFAGRVAAAHGSSEDEHPTDKHRLSRIFLSSAKLCESYGCSVAPGQDCSQRQGSAAEASTAEDKARSSK